MLSAGKLDQRIRIQTPVEKKEGAGGSVKKWADQWARWAQVITMAGREMKHGGVLVPEHTHLVRMRYLPELTTAHRILWGGRVLQIIGVADKDGQREETTVECNEVDNG
jgi:SPP1 family predicted phage head-tail adaptor